MRLPLLPGAAVEPHLAVAHPRPAGELFQRRKHRRQADPVRAVRIGKVAGGIDLLWLDSLEQVGGDLDVAGPDRQLSHSAGFIERQIEEVDAVWLHAGVAGGGAGLGAPNQPLDHLQFGEIDGASRLCAQKVADRVGDLAGLGADAIRAAKLLHKIDVPIGRFIPHGDVAAGLVGDMHIVPLLAEADERAPHADHIVVGVRAEDHDPLGKHFFLHRDLSRGTTASCARPCRSQPPRPPRLAAGPAGDRVLHGAEDGDVDVVGPPAGGEEVLQTVAVVILVGQLEDRLLQLQRQPDHSLADEGFGPLQPQRVEGSHQPRGLEAGEPGSGRPIEHKPGVGVLLQRTGRNMARGEVFDGIAHDRSLVLAEGQQHHAAGVEDRSHTHRDRLPGNIPFAEEITGGVAAGNAVERDQAGTALLRAARFIESDVASAADAEQLQIDPPGLADQFLIPHAKSLNIAPLERAVGNMDRLSRDVDMIKQMLPHEAVVALQRSGLHRPVFVEVKRHHRAERNALLPVQPHQLVIHAHRRAPCRQPQHRLETSGGPRLHQLHDLASHRPAGVPRLVEYRHWHPLDDGACMLRGVRHGAPINWQRRHGWQGWL